jgi:hypothetical protein
MNELLLAHQRGNLEGMICGLLDLDYDGNSNQHHKHVLHRPIMWIEFILQTS